MNCKCRTDIELCVNKCSEMTWALCWFSVLARLNWGPKIVSLFPTVVHYKPERNKKGANLAITQLVYVQSALRISHKLVSRYYSIFSFSVSIKAAVHTPSGVNYLLINYNVIRQRRCMLKTYFRQLETTCACLVNVTVKEAYECNKIIFKRLTTATQTILYYWQQANRLLISNISSLSFQNLDV